MDEKLLNNHADENNHYQQSCLYCYGKGFTKYITIDYHKSFTVNYLYKAVLNVDQQGLNNVSLVTEAVESNRTLK